MEGEEQIASWDTPSPLPSGPSVASLMLTLGLAPVPFLPTPLLWAGGPRGPSPEDEVMRWLRLVQSTFVPEPSGGGGGGGRCEPLGSWEPPPHSAPAPGL